MTSGASEGGRSRPSGREITGPQVRPATSVGQVWRRRAGWAVRGLGPPTVPIGVPGSGDDDVSQRHARAVLDLALRAGEALLTTGGSAAEVVATVLRLTSAYGVPSTSVDITYTSISVSIERGLDQDSLAVLRVIKVRSPDYSRLEALQLLVDGITDRARAGQEPIPVDDARERLDDLLRAPHPYRRWVVTLGYALMAAGVVILFGAAPGMWVVAALSATIVDRVQRRLHQIGIAAFFRQALSAAIPTAIAAGLFVLTSVGVDVPGLTSPSLLVVSGIIVLLAGLSVMGAAEDAIDGYYVTAGARGLEVLMLTLGIALGISAVLALAGRFGVNMFVSSSVNLGGSPLTGTIGATIVALGFALSTYTGVRATGVSALLAALTWICFEALGPLGLGTAATVTVAAAVAGALGHLAHRTLHVPELAVTTAAIVSLLPGLSVYRGLSQILQGSGQLSGGALELISALGIALGLAAGLSIGAYAARLRFGLDRAAIRARRQAVGGWQE
ncbi:MAG: threonine/serine ThrE exporter family protein [Ornithinimicrobium sp.]|uniref:threonine/serine ThrE exporter family protein n=1 Tax=Ornithinimicrobium sp. TaxID=1977084 RepID=UPI003D9B4D3E